MEKFLGSPGLIGVQSQLPLAAAPWPLQGLKPPDLASATLSGRAVPRSSCTSVSSSCRGGPVLASRASIAAATVSAALGVAAGRAGKQANRISRSGPGSRARLDLGSSFCASKRLARRRFMFARCTASCTPAAEQSSWEVLLPGDAVHVAVAESEPPLQAFLQFPETLDGKPLCTVLLAREGTVISVGADAVRPVPPLITGRVPDVTVQVVTFKQPDLLRHALMLISLQDVPRSQLEVLVVDDSLPSCALAQGALEGLDASFVQECVRIIRLEESTSLGAKLNLTTALSRGKVVLRWDGGDYFGQNRVRAQSAPILSGEADITLLHPTFGYLPAEENDPNSGSFCKLDGVPSISLCSLCFRRNLWDSEDVTRCYAVSSLLEGSFLARNLTELHQACLKELPQGEVDFVHATVA
ncbi:unnamed protein product, partial [Polarella glacialis]